MQEVLRASTFRERLPVNNWLEMEVVAVDVCFGSNRVFINSVVEVWLSWLFLSKLPVFLMNMAYGIYMHT